MKNVWSLLCGIRPSGSDVAKVVAPFRHSHAGPYGPGSLPDALLSSSGKTVAIRAAAGRRFRAGGPIDLLGAILEIPVEMLLQQHIAEHFIYSALKLTSGAL